MAKPLGLVAMLTLLLSSGTALADERLPVWNIDVWGVTHAGKLFLQTKTGDRYLAPIEHCPIVRSRDPQLQHSPINEIVAELENPNIHVHGRVVSSDMRITLFEKKKRIAKTSVKCVIGDLQKV